MLVSNELLKRLGIRHPIIQAPMAGATTPALAAAVCRAGALGSLGCAMLTAEQVQAQVQETRAHADGPINVNFFVHPPPELDAGKIERARGLLRPFYQELGLGEVPAGDTVAPAFDDAMLAAILEIRPEVVSFHFGLPPSRMVDAVRETGAAIFSSATTVREARTLAECGVDAVIAQGWEAGGHRGTFESSFASAQVGTVALLPQVVDAVDVPVIAAGGIADGRGITACLALGASAVQMGTAFLACPEAGISDAHRRALAAASDEDTCVTKAFSGRPARGLANRYIEAMREFESDLPDFPVLNALGGPLRKASADAGRPDFVALWSGEAAALNQTLPAEELVKRLVADAEWVLRNLSR